MKYYEKIDLNNPRIIHLHDFKTDIHIGYIEELLNGKYKAVNYQNKKEIFSFDAIAKGWISSFIYVVSKKKKYNNQLRFNFIE